MNHEKWMQYALTLADKAEALGEVPVGAVLIQKDEVIGEGFNQVITLNDPTAHAEVMALRDAGQTVENYRLNDTTLYVTLEPCPMCSGAIVHARVGTVVYGASDARTGSAGSVFNIVHHPALNHRAQVVRGVLEEECRTKIQQFFKLKRQSSD